MSFCRWSSNDFQCDVYVYEDICGGFTTHVATTRVVYAAPLPAPVPFDSDHLDAFLAREVAVTAMVEQAEREPIALPHAGETFNDATKAECAERLAWLRDLGYRVPAYAIASLRSDAAEGGDDQGHR